MLVFYIDPLLPAVSEELLVLVLELFTEPEIDKFDAPVFLDEYVFQLDVAMNNQLLMEVFHCPG